MAPRYFISFILGRSVIVRTDSTDMAYANYWGGVKSLFLNAGVRLLQLWAQPRSVSVCLRAFNLPGSLNAATDLLSRGGPHPDNWCLDPQILMQVWLCLGQAEVDLFDSTENTHCSLWSSMRGPQALWGWMPCHGLAGRCVLYPRCLFSGR